MASNYCAAQHNLLECRLVSDSLAHWGRRGGVMKSGMKLGWVVVAVLGMLGFAPQASAESIPVETAWAQGTRWTYHTQFLGRIQE